LHYFEITRLLRFARNDIANPIKINNIPPHCATVKLKYLASDSGRSVARKKSRKNLLTPYHSKSQTV